MMKPFYFCKFHLFSLVFFSLISCACDGKSGESYMVIWKGTTEFNNKISAAKISPKEAYDLLKEKSSRKEGVVYGNYPILIVDDAYLFSKPNKIGADLNGYYVNIMTGKIEYKMSNSVLKNGDKYVYSEYYSESYLISPGLWQ